jgi:MFS family permease
MRLSGAVRSMASGFGSVAASPNLRRLEGAYAASMTADWAFTVGLGVYAYQAAGPIAVGIVGLIRMLPAALATPLTAAVGERLERERVLAGVSLVSAIALGLSALAFYAGGVMPGGSLPSILLLAALHGVVSTLIRPGVSALLPSLSSTPEQVIAGNAANSTIEGLGTLLGPLLAGVIVAIASPGAVFAFGAATYLLAALLFAWIRVEGRMRLAVERPGGLLAGFTVLARDRQVLLVVGLIVAQAVVRGALNTLIVVIAFDVLATGASWVGFLSAAVGAGSLVGGVAAAAMSGRRVAGPFGIGLLLWGLPLITLAVIPSPATALGLLAVIGIGNAVEDVAGFTLLQRLVSDEMLGRVLGVLFGAVMGAIGIGSILAPLLLGALGTTGSLVAVGAFLPLLVLLFTRQLRALDRSAVVPRQELALLERVPMFAPLSVVAKECLASRFVPVHADARTTIVTEGEPGDRFYVVATGQVRVLQAGAPIDGRGSRDYFGEIALIRDSPRTATVVAESDVELFALDRSDFLAAVTGHRLSTRAADDVVSVRLSPSDGAER